MKRLLLLPALFLVCACGSTQRSPEEELASLNQNLDLFNLAFKEGNLNVLDSLTTNDYTHTNGNDKAFSKQSWFNYLEKRTGQIRSGELRVDEYELLEKEIILYGTTAIVTGQIVLTGNNQGEPFKRALRISNFWVKENGTWKRAGFHDTRIE